MTAPERGVVADQVQPLGATTLKVSIPPDCGAKALPGLRVRVEQGVVASEISVIKASFEPVGSVVDVTGKPTPPVLPVTNAWPATSVATAEAKVLLVPPKYVDHASADPPPFSPVPFSLVTKAASLTGATTST
jgi:hypothetical protein